ncbi:MAG: C13 family peptidase [Planctomycetota bacterium]
MAILAVLLFGLTLEARARDFFFVVGGGPEPWSNQVSIEHNVEFYQATMARIRDTPRSETLFFASGQSGQPDVCHIAALDVPEANRLLALASGDRRDLRLAFRRHQLSGVNGGILRHQVLEKLRGMSRELGPGDRLLLYFTGHGGKGSPVTNGCFYAWNRERITVRDLAEVLDRYSPEVEVMLVMVQCYSGSFANILFTGGDPEHGLASHRRAGFFGTIATRPAAGCTADMKKEDYEEYSTYFWSAVGGIDRTGKDVLAGDLDGDGKQTFVDAHVHALLHSPTIDISMRTSDEYLRRFGREKGKESTGEDRLLAWDSPYASLLEGAGPDLVPLLEGLSRKLNLSGEDRVAVAARLAESVEQGRRRNQQEIRKMEGAVRNAAVQIGQALMVQWPFLRSAWHPETQALLTTGGNELITFMTSHREFGNYAELSRMLKDLKEKDLAEERRWAGLQRFVRAAESAALAHNLQFEKDSSLRSRYDELLRLERWEVAPTGKIPK